MPIKKQEYIERMKRVQDTIRQDELDAFLITAQDSIYYLTGVTYAPLERPFFILVRPDTTSALLAPLLDREHLASAPNVGEVLSYWDYPSPPGNGWRENLFQLLQGIKSLGVEPTLP
jgi:Xaa-Pro dipeptidase